MCANYWGELPKAPGAWLYLRGAVGSFDFLVAEEAQLPDLVGILRTPNPATIAVVALHQTRATLRARHKVCKFVERLDKYLY